MKLYLLKLFEWFGVQQLFEIFEPQSQPKSIIYCIFQVSYEKQSQKLKWIQLVILLKMIWILIWKHW